MFDECFKASYTDIVKRRESVETAIKSLCISIINIYKLYCPDLPNSEEIAQNIDTLQDPEAKLELEVAKLASNFDVMTYRLPNIPESPDFRIISGAGWEFVNQTALGIMKQGLQDYYTRFVEKEVSPQVIKELFVEKPLPERILTSMTKWFTGARCVLFPTNARNELSTTKLAQQLVIGLSKALESNPNLISKVVDVRRPFDMVRSKAQEMQLQDRFTSTETIHRCVGLVNDDIIFACNSELSAFGLAMSKSMRASLHMLMLQYLIAFNLRYHSKRLEEHTSQQLRDSWKATFMEQTLRGPARDSANVESIVNRFAESLQHYCLEKARKVFNEATDRFQRSSTRFQLQLGYEGNIATRSKEELLKYVHDPISVISTMFDAQWKVEEIQILEQARLVYLEEGTSLLALEQWMAAVHKQIESAKFSTANDIFLAPSGLGAVQALLKKEKALVFLFCDLLRGRRANARYTIDGLELDVVDWVVPSSSSSSNENGHRIEKLDYLIREIATIGTIFDLFSFSSKLVARLAAIGNQLRRHQCVTATLDPNNRLQVVKERAGGCNQACPCCKRVCDEEHWLYNVPAGIGVNRHKCRLGHQYRGMAGFAYEKNKLASLKTCGDITNDEKLWFQDRYFLWSEFKEKFPSWDFEYPVHSKGANTSIIPHLWNEVGEELCSEYPCTYLPFL